MGGGAGGPWKVLGRGRRGGAHLTGRRRGTLARTRPRKDDTRSADMTPANGRRSVRERGVGKRGSGSGRGGVRSPSRFLVAAMGERACRSGRCGDEDAIGDAIEGRWDFDAPQCAIFPAGEGSDPASVSETARNGAGRAALAPQARGAGAQVPEIRAHQRKGHESRRRVLYSPLFERGPHRPQDVRLPLGRRTRGGVRGPRQVPVPEGEGACQGGDCPLAPCRASTRGGIAASPLPPPPGGWGEAATTDAPRMRRPPPTPRSSWRRPRKSTSSDSRTPSPR